MVTETVPKTIQVYEKDWDSLAGRISKLADENAFLKGYIHGISCRFGVDLSKDIPFDIGFKDKEDKKDNY